MRLCACLLAALCVAAPARAALDPEGRLAVLDFKNKLENPKEVDPTYFADVVRAAALKAAPGLKVITRENLLVLLQNTGRKLDECEGECEVDTGRRIGADLVISGDLLKVGTSYKLNLRLHETHDGQLVSGAVASGKTVDELDANTQPAVNELLAPLHAASGLTRKMPETHNSAPAAAVQAEPRKGDPTLRKSGFIFLGAGVLCGLGGAYYAWRSKSLVNDIKNGNVATGADIETKSFDSQSASKQAWVLTGVGAAALALGGVLVWLNPAQPQVALQAGNGVSLAGRF